MDEEQRRLVVESWATVKNAGAENVGELFFRNVFTAAPQTVQLFSFRDEPDIYASKSLRNHGAAVINTVGIAVAGLRDFESLVPLIQVLGRRHRGLGLTKEHFSLLGTELLRTLGNQNTVFAVS